MATSVGAAKTKTDVKIIILGDTNVGKTCLIQRYLTGEFGAATPSIGASLAMKKLEDWNIALWDTAGEEKYANLSSFYCRGAQVAILAIDLTNKQTLEQLQRVFIPLLEEQAKTCMVVVVGTKLDLVKKNGRDIGASECKTFAQNQHQIHLTAAMEANPNTFLSKIDPNELYYETSSKTGEGVPELFKYIERVLLTQLRSTAATGGTGKRDRSCSKRGKPSEMTISLDSDPPPPSEQQSKCCNS